MPLGAYLSAYPTKTWSDCKKNYTALANVFWKVFLLTTQA